MVGGNGTIVTIDIFSTTSPNFETVSRVWLTIGCFTVWIGTVYDDVVAADNNNEEPSSLSFGQSPRGGGHHHHFSL